MWTRAFFLWKHQPSSKHHLRTFDDQWEVPIREGGWTQADPAPVVGVVDSLVSCREHIQHPLHGIVWVVPEQVPVDHPLHVPHHVPGPHHTAAYTLQHHLWSSRGTHVVPSHHYTASVWLAWCWRAGRVERNRHTEFGDFFKKKRTPLTQILKITDYLVSSFCMSGGLRASWGWMINNL